MAEKIERFEIMGAYTFVRDSLIRSKKYIERKKTLTKAQKELEIELYEELIKCVEEWYETYMVGSNYYG